MEKFEYFKKYIFEQDDLNASENKHSFYSLTKEDILEGERRLGFKFPQELKTFYENIGYGFLCNFSQEMFNRFMDPESVTDFRLCENIYETNQKWEFYDEKYLVIFEVNEDSFISIDLQSETDDGVCSVYYYDKKVADSIEEFLKKLDIETNFYLL